MIKKITSVTVLIVLIALLSLSAFADQPLVIDTTGTLSADEINSLTQSAKKISDTYNCDVVVVFTPTFEGLGGGEFSDRVWEKGYNNNCIMFALATQSREYYFYACGEGSKVITDYGSMYIDEKVRPELTSHDYYKAADRFLVLTSEFLNHYHETGSAYDVNDKPSDIKMTILSILGCSGLGLLLSGLPVLSQKKKLKSVEPKTDADDYLSPNGIHMLRNRDHFVTKNVTAIPIPKVEHHSGGGGFGGGGTSFHTSSSGHSYSGHGGKF